jgi:hypothetical protein
MRFAPALFISLAAALTVAPTAARAGERDVASEDGARRTTEERAFVYSVDPTTPDRGGVSFESSVGLGSGVAALRPLPATNDARAIESSLTANVGIGSGLAPFITGVRGFGDGVPSGVGAIAGMRWQITPGEGPFRAGLVAAGFREPGGAYGAYLRATATYDVDRLRLGANVHAEHPFQSGRDALDVFVTLAASYRIVPGFRLGAEYVGQDLEEIGDPGAEGGAKQYAGPTTAIELDRGRVQIVAGPAIGLGGNSARWVGRASLLVSF